MKKEKNPITKEKLILIKTFAQVFKYTYIFFVYFGIQYLVQTRFFLSAFCFAMVIILVFMAYPKLDKYLENKYNF